MPVVNYVLFKFADSATEEDRARVCAENEHLGNSLKHIGVESVHCKPIIPGAPDFITKGFHVASITTLRDLDALKAFREEQLHKDTIAKHKPFFADICATQIEY
ncbi:hypothetical protein V8E36_008900 [Tilletia maclaganii]